VIWADFRIFIVARGAFWGSVQGLILSLSFCSVREKALSAAWKGHEGGSFRERDNGFFQGKGKARWMSIDSPRQESCFYFLPIRGHGIPVWLAINLNVMLLMIMSKQSATNFF
jgi:hypothetical protein